MKRFSLISRRGKKNRNSNQRASRRKLSLESLEERQLLDATADWMNTDMSGWRETVSFVVNTTADVVADDGNCSLREAILRINQGRNSEAPVIYFSPSLSGQTIELDPAYGELIICKSTFILAEASDEIQTPVNIVVSGGYSNRILEINSTAEDVILSGLTLKNGSAENGGAIYVNSDVAVELNEIAFLNNSVDSSLNDACGGAIYVSSGDDLTLNDVVFSGNTATASTSRKYAFGGAVYNNGGHIHINRGSFEENSSKDYGGAIYVNDGDIYVNDGASYDNPTAFCSFSGNSSNNRDGGAIYVNGGKVAVTNGSFNKNKANQYGGALCNNDEAELIVANCSFIGNEANTGGSIYNYSDGTTTVVGGSFIGNTANTAGAICNSGTLNVAGNSVVGDVLFYRNTATDGDGGAVSTNAADFTKVEFVDNSSSSSGGALYVGSGTVNFSDVTLTNNIANEGGAIYNSDGTVTVNSSAFNSNGQKSDGTVISKNGGAVYNKKTLKVGETSSVSFNGNSAKTSGGAIYNLNETTLVNVMSTNNVANEGGAIYNTGSSANISVNGGTFNNNGKTSNGIVITTSGGAFYNVASGSLKIGDSSSVTFNGNSAENGGAIYNIGNDSSVKTLNSTFKNNTADVGGAISIKGGTVDVNGSVFTNNGQKSDGTLVTTNGGAIYNEGTLNVGKTSSVTFDANSAKNGGAIYNMSGSGSVNTSNSMFKNNVANEGGAIYINGGTVDVNGGVFVNNGKKSDGTVITTNGGAIYNEGVLNVGKTDSVKFEGNSALASGGAINNNNESCVAELWSSKFVNNTANSSGGAIYVKGTVVSNGNSFTNNGKTKNADETQTIVTQDGGAVYVAAGTFKTEKDKFVCNAAILYGGATYIKEDAEFDATKVTFENVNKASRGGAVANFGTFIAEGGEFTGNIATPLKVDATNGSFGGAIYNAGTVELTELVFSDNMAIDECVYVDEETEESTPRLFTDANGNLKGYSGGAIYNSKGEINANFVTFDNNFAEKYGGAVSNFGTFNATFPLFSNNSAATGGALQNAGVATLSAPLFETNSALTRRDVPISGTDCGGNGGAIFQSNNASNLNDDSSLTLKEEDGEGAWFEDNFAQNAGGALDIVSGKITFNGSITIINNRAGVVGGAIVFVGAANDIEFENGPFFEFCDDSNVAPFAQTIAAACDADTATTLKNAFFSDETVDYTSFDTFTRARSITNTNDDLSLDFDFFASAATDAVDSVTVYVNRNNAVTLRSASQSVTLSGLLGGNWSQVAEGNSIVVNYYFNGASDYVFKMTLLKEENGSMMIQKIDMTDHAPAGTVGFNFRTFDSEPISSWSVSWGDEKTSTYVGLGFLWNAYNIYDEEGETYNVTLSVVYADGREEDFRFTCVSPNNTTTGGSAVLDETSLTNDFFADEELIDDLFVL